MRELMYKCLSANIRSSASVNRTGLTSTQAQTIHSSIDYYSMIKPIIRCV